MSSLLYLNSSELIETTQFFFIQTIFLASIVIKLFHIYFMLVYFQLYNVIVFSL